MTLSEVEPATFRLVTQCFNQHRYRASPFNIRIDWNWYVNDCSSLSQSDLGI